jgi:hypothetical protein
VRTVGILNQIEHVGGEAEAVAQLLDEEAGVDKGQ